MRTRLIGFAAAAAAIAALTAPTAEAAPDARPLAQFGCVAGSSYPEDFWCHNAQTIVYSGPHYNGGTLNVGNLNSTYSWFTCWTAGTDQNNNYETWFYTESDDGGWGYVPVSKVDTMAGDASSAWYNECGAQ